MRRGVGRSFVGVDDVHANHLPRATLRHRDGLPPVSTAKIEHRLVLEQIKEAGDRLAEELQGVVEMGLLGPARIISGAWPSRKTQQNAFTDRTHTTSSLPRESRRAVRSALGHSRRAISLLVY